MELTSRWNKRNYGALIATVLLLAGVCACAWIVRVPLMSRAGDTFGCWFGYIQNWQQSGLAKALQNADSPGRYPGYPALIRMFQSVLDGDFLQALLWSRIFGLAGTLLVLYFLLRKLQLSALESAIYALSITAVPMHWISIALNSQDTLKVVFFLCAILMTLMIDSQPQVSAKKNVFYLIMALSSMWLAAVRGPEVLPFWAFIALYQFPDLKLGWKKYVRSASFFILPSFLLLVGLHLYGRIVVGHFGLSGPPSSSADNWPKLTADYIAEQHQDSIIEVFNFIRLAGITFLNKMGYVAEDFIFDGADTRILDNHFVSSLQMTDSLRIFVYYPAGLLITAVMGWLFLSKKTSKVIKALVFSGLASAGFYLFLFNHYEPRYWLLFTFAGLVSVVAYFGRSKIFLIAAAIVFLLFEIPMGLRAHENDLQVDRDTQTLAKKWENDAQIACESGIKLILAPERYLTYTAFKYLTLQKCSSVRFESIELAKQQDLNPNEIRILDVEYFEESHILGLSHNKFLF